MNRTAAGLVLCLSLVGSAAIAAPPPSSVVSSLVRGVIAALRHDNRNLSPYEAVELRGVRYIASARSARIVRQRRAVGDDSRMAGSWAQVKVSPLDRNMHDVAEGGQWLMHRTHGVWHSVAFTDEGNGYTWTTLRRVHIPDSVIHRLNLTIVSG